MGCFDLEDAERGMLQCRQGSPFRDIDRPMLADKAIDSGGAAGRGAEQSDIESKRQSLGHRDRTTFLVIHDPAVGKPVPRGLLDLGLGYKRHGSKAQLAHVAMQA